DHHGVPVLLDAPQLLDPAEVDQQTGIGHPHPQHRQQALPAGEHLGVLPALGQRGDRFLHGGGGDVVELGRNHWAPPWVSIEPSPPPASDAVVPLERVPVMARHTRCGEHGISTSLTPRCRSASTTPLTTAGVEAMVPASPTPLTPSGLEVAGVSVRSVTNSGRSAADGTR